MGAVALCLIVVRLGHSRAGRSAAVASSEVDGSLRARAALDEVGDLIGLGRGVGGHSNSLAPDRGGRQLIAGPRLRSIFLH
jgi:hypothetical protein